MDNNGILPGKRDDTYVYHAGDGYYYHIKHETCTTIYYKCRKASCTGRSQLTWGQFVNTVCHTHPPDPLYQQVMALRESIVHQARSARYMSFVDIVHLERSRIQNREVRSLVTYRSTRSAMQRARNAIFPPIPDSLQSLSDILQNRDYAHVTQTTDLSDNLYQGSVLAADGSHAIIFISARCLNILRQVHIVFADSTFCIAPAVFGCYQVFTIVSINGHTIIPLMWALMERKSESAYTAVLSYLQVLLGNWMFQKVICDFEDGLINAFETVFNVIVQGCFFHSVNAMCTWARVNMTVTLYIDHPELLNVIAQCCALPLLPQQYLHQGYRVICTAAFYLGPYLYYLCVPFLEYIRRDWIEHVNRGRTFSVSGSEHRTNNACESNNRRMKRQIGHPHPNIYQFLRKLAEFEDSTIDDLNSLQRGRLPNRERDISSLSNDARILALTRSLLQNPYPSDEEIFSFLCAASFSSRNLFLYALGLEIA